MRGKCCVYSGLRIFTNRVVSSLFKMLFLPHIKEEDESDELGFTKIGGVFVVLVLGCLIAFMFSILEFLWNIRKVAIEEEVILNTGPYLGT